MGAHDTAVGRQRLPGPPAGPRTPRATLTGVRRMLLVVLGLLVAEVVTIVLLASAVGALPTFLVIIATSAVGAWLTRVEGVGAIRRVREAVAAGRPPTRELVDAALVVTAGLLLLLPGLVSDLVGIVLAFPPVRQAIGTWLLGQVRPRSSVIFGSGGPTSVRFGTSFGAPTGRPGTAGTTDTPPPTWIRHEEIIDLEADEYFVDEPRGELGGGPGSDR